MSPIVTTMSAPAGRGRRVKAPAGGGVSPFFADNFSGGQYNNANGFTWGAASGGAALSTDLAVSGGTHSIKFTYAAGTGSETVEKRFNLGRACSEFAMEWQWHIPSNYYHTNANGINNKLLALWGASSNLTTSASLGAQREVLEYWTNADEPGGSKLRTMITFPDNNTTSIVLAVNRPVFIGASGPLYKGQWNAMRFYTKMSSGAGVADGIMRVWGNGTLIANHTGLVLWNSDSSGLSTCVLEYGYVMGATNSGWDEQTTFYCADFKFYDTNPGWAA